mmetsp:Transcript_8974/g.19371  ORF Transcript_8974/g.19371 Transcript_8974/m.19371 type:complete len:83 (+) Transcript_8974:868-1116(+)
MGAGEMKFPSVGGIVVGILFDGAGEDANGGRGTDSIKHDSASSAEVDKLPSQHASIVSKNSTINSSWGLPFLQTKLLQSIYH